MGTNNFKLVANNKRPFTITFIDDKYETGIELYGTGGKIHPAWENAALGAFVRIGKRPGLYVRHAYQSL